MKSCNPADTDMETSTPMPIYRNETRVRRLTLVPALIVSLGLLSVGAVKAQPFNILHTFTATSSAGGTNADGATPAAGLFLSGNILYGATTSGGTNGIGTVFAINTDGTGFTNLYNASNFGSFVSSPSSPLVRSGGNLYGLSLLGGPAHRGNVFKVKTDGTGGASVYNFTNSGLAQPQGELVLAGDTLYGTTSTGGNGASAGGTLFAVNTNGGAYTNLHRFSAGSTNSDGGFPRSGLILAGSTLYGTARQAGAFGSGAIFAMNTNGTGFVNLHSFSAVDLFVSPTTNSDGFYPEAGLLLVGNRLYGTASSGGDAGNGTVFALNTDGTGFTTLHSFSPLSDPGVTPGTNSDGAVPLTGLVIFGDTLYGTTGFGGSSGSGTLFGISTNGSGFTNLYSFSTLSNGSSSATNSDGSYPNGRLVLSGHTLYGTTQQGGAFGNGTLFSYTLPTSPQPAPSLSIASVGDQLVIFWPASATNYILQSTTNSASTNWATATDAIPVIAVTVSNLPPGRFFRLQQQP